MKIIEAFNKLKPLEGQILPQTASTNKGRFGQQLEIFLGLSLGPNKLDFEDGELKTVTLKSNGLIKEDLKIAKVWNKNYLEEKLDNLLIVVKDTSNKIILTKLVKPLSNPVYKKYFNIEYEKIMTIGLDKISQSDTAMWVAKTNDTGKKERNERAFYLAAQFVNVLLGLKFTSTKKTSKEVYKEIIQYEQTKNRS